MAILIVIIIIQRGVRVKRKRKPGSEGSRARPMRAAGTRPPRETSANVPEEAIVQEEKAGCPGDPERTATVYYDKEAFACLCA